MFSYLHNPLLQIQSENSRLTFGLALGLSCSSFLAAASIDAAAPSSSVSAMTVGSSGSTHSEPESVRARSQIKLCPVTNSSQKPKTMAITRENTASHAQMMEAKARHSLQQRWSDFFRV